jgi:hypothetical protein
MQDSNHPVCSSTQCAIGRGLLNCSLVFVISYFVFFFHAGCHPEGSPDSSGDSWAASSASGSGTLTALYVPAEGFAMQDGDRLTGVTVEILREFARWVVKEHGITVGLEFVAENDFRIFMDTVAGADEEDGLIGFANVTITDARREFLDFSPPYMSNIAVLISHENRSELGAFNQFETVFSGLTALAFEGTLHENRLMDLRNRWYENMPVEYAGSNREIIERVAGGDRYIAYVDVYNYWRALEDGEPVKRHQIGDDAAEEFGYILPKGSGWTPVLQDFFRHDGGFTSSETYRLILQEHLGEGLAELLLRSK